MSTVASDSERLTKSQRRKLEGHVRRMPRLKRFAFVLAVFDNQSTASIAERLSITEEQTRRYISDSLRECAEIISKGDAA